MKKTHTRKRFEAELIEFLVNDYFDGKSQGLARHTGYTHQQVQHWMDDVHKPNSSTIWWLLSSVIAPEFKIACEYEQVELTSGSAIRGELRRVLGDHGKLAGVYAFYDSMCNLIYLGKASRQLSEEMYQQLRGKLGVPFPAPIKKAPAFRWQATHFVSAYEIPEVTHLDFPKHVEALMLRIAKPIGNKVTGRLSFSKPPKP